MSRSRFDLLAYMRSDEYWASQRELIYATVEESVRASFAAFEAKRAAEQPIVWESSAALGPEKPTHDAAAPISLQVAAGISSILPTREVFHDVAAPAASTEALATDTTGGAAPTSITCSTGGLNHDADGDDSTPSCLLPAAAPALGTELIAISAVRVGMLPSSLIAISACGDDLDADEDMKDMFLTGPEPTEVSTFLIAAKAKPALSTLQMPIEHSLDIEGPGECVLILQPKPPWSYLAQTISSGVAESLHLIGKSFELNQFGVDACPLLSARFRPTKAYFLRDDTGPHLVPTQPMLGGVLNIGVSRIVDTTKPDSLASHEAISVEVLSLVDANLGNELRPPWPPPELGIIDCHIQDAAGGWVHSLEIAGRILLNQLGKFLSSPSSITVNDTSSPCTKWCLADVSWRLHKWCSVTHCVQLTNAMLHAQYSGMRSDLSCASATTHLMFLLPWDLGEKTRVSRNSVLSRDIAWGACFTQLNADFLDNYDHLQQSRYRVIAVVSLILLVMCNEAVLWPFLQSATGHMIQLLPWDPGQPFYGMGTKLTTASGVICLQENSVHELFFCSAEVDTITKCKMALAELQPWPSWESYFLVLTVYLGNWNVELVQLQPWPSWKLSLSILTWLECFCDILFCTDSEVNWTNQTVFNNDGYWCGPMQPVYPNLISATNLFFRALPGHFHMWLMLWKTTEDSIIRSLLQGGLPRLMWFIGNLMLLSIAPENSGMVTYLHSRGLPATDEVDCVALIMTLVVSDASTYPDLSFSSVGMVAIDSPGLDEGQARNMLLVVCVAWPLDLEHFSSANHYVQPLRPTTVRYEGSIENRITVLPQISARTVQALLLLSWSQSCCTGFHFFITNHDLLVGGNESNYSALMPWQLLQWIIAWPLYPAPRQSWFSYCTPGSKVALHNSEPLQGNIQQPEFWRFQLLTVKLSYSVTASYICIAGLFRWAQSFGNFHCMVILTDYNKVLHITWDFRGRLLLSTRCGAATDQGKASSSIPWDPGGAV